MAFVLYQKKTDYSFGGRLDIMQCVKFKNITMDQKKERKRNQNRLM